MGNTVEPGSLLRRYLAGEHEAVWAEMMALGPRVREASSIDDAWAVARETMRRARHNVELLIRRLDQIGYQFWNGQHGKPGPQPLRMMMGGQAIEYPSLEAMVERVLSSLGRIDLLVNNAGISMPDAFIDLSEEAWDSQIDVNLKGTFLCSQAVARHMLARGEGGAIVNLCSIASFGGQEGRAGYAASKAGLLGLTRVMAQELSPHGIRVNAVAPSLIGTEMIERIVPESFRDGVVLDRTPLGRLGRPAEVADAVLFLLSEGAAYITGASLMVDGGLTSGPYHSAQARGQSFRRSRPG